MILHCNSITGAATVALREASTGINGFQYSRRVYSRSGEFIIAFHDEFKIELALATARFPM
jgi:hypothetical protein